ncbi:hypothetical protein [Flavobacterium sp. W20_MBD1_R3]|uniref:hypothetical protein n=1 Tax=Flavobacterium sp. W20_MBD1_R3 TaxID=3240278 RepID=UPI003F8DE77B
MIRTLIKLNLLVLFIAFSAAWISDAVAILSNDKKYEFFEVSENSAEENNLESKLKILYTAVIEFPNSLESYSLDLNRISRLDLFKVKESTLKNLTPPPEAFV